MSYKLTINCSSGVSQIAGYYANGTTPVAYITATATVPAEYEPNTTGYYYRISATSDITLLIGWTYPINWQDNYGNSGVWLSSASATPSGFSANQSDGRTITISATASGSYPLTIQPSTISGVSYVYGYWSDTGTWQYAYKSSPISHTFSSSGGYFYIDQVGYDTNYTYPVYVDGATLIDSSGSFVAHKVMANDTSGRTAYITCTYAQTYTITAQSSDTTKGTVAGGGTGTSGNYTYLMATANTGYAFNYWTKDGTYYSSTYYISSLEYNSTNAGTYVAYFTSTIITDEAINLTLDSSTSTSLTITASMLYARGYDRWIQLGEGTTVIASANIASGATSCSFTISNLLTGQNKPEGYTYNAIARYNSTSGQIVGQTTTNLTAFTRYFTSWVLVGSGAITSGEPDNNMTASAWRIMNGYLSDKALYRHGQTFTPTTVASGGCQSYLYYNRAVNVLSQITGVTIPTVASGSILSATKLNLIPTYINTDDN